MYQFMKQFALMLAIALAPLPVFADAPEITQVRVIKEGMGWRFFVTISHGDTGWDHYANGWEVLDAQGNVLGYREMMHPHVAEQPFTRSLGHVMLPDGTREVFVRAKCSLGDTTAEAVRVAIDYYD